MVFIKRKAKYLNRKILNTYMAYPLIIQKKAMQILNVNMGIIFISTLFLAFRVPNGPGPSLRASPPWLCPRAAAGATMGSPSW